jgi:hypothetical protein
VLEELDAKARLDKALVLIKKELELGKIQQEIQQQVGDGDDDDDDDDDENDDDHDDDDDDDDDDVVHAGDDGHDAEKDDDDDHEDADVVSPRHQVEAKISQKQREYFLTEQLKYIKKVGRSYPDDDEDDDNDDDDDDLSDRSWGWRRTTRRHSSANSATASRTSTVRVAKFHFAPMGRLY